MFRLSKKFLVVAALVILLAGQSAAMVPVRAQGDSKIVYVAICVDTENFEWEGPDIGSTDPHPLMDMRDIFSNITVDCGCCF